MSIQSECQGKVVVITGASSGFGKGTATELARRGASVVLAARSADLIDGLADECVNAGVAAIGRFDEVPLEDHEQVIRTDLLGTIYGSHVAMRHFRDRRAGILINVASVLGKIPAPLYASYAAAKFGVVGLSDVLRQELQADTLEAVRVCTVMPMAHSTDFFEHAGNYTGHKAEPIPPTYDPKVTIGALVGLVTDPKNEVITGRQGGPFEFFHRLMPNAIEWLMTKNTVKSQLQDAPPAPETSGNLHQASGE